MELLGLYLGDGHIVRARRTFRFRLFMDARYRVMNDQIEGLLRRMFPANRVARLSAHDGRMVIFSLYNTHLPCLFPQHGPGLKSRRAMTLLAWQEALVRDHPWRLLRGLIRSDGCHFVNRTGPYEYFSYDFTNTSVDLLHLFARTCAAVGVDCRQYDRRVRIYRRPSVALMQQHVGLKR